MEFGSIYQWIVASIVEDKHWVRRGATAVGLLLLLAGYIYIPLLGSTSPERLGEIKVGSTIK